MTEILGIDAAQYPPLNILLAEDNEADFKITMRALQSTVLKNRVLRVADGQECLDYLRQQGDYSDEAQYPRPDLVLLDINMPRVDGYGVLTVIKADPGLKMIPVVMLSASKSEEDVRRSYQLGANSFIQKPVEYDHFVQVVAGLTYYWQVLNRLPGRKN